MNYKLYHGDCLEQMIKLTVQDLNGYECEVFVADKYVKASESKYEYYSGSDFITAYYPTNQLEENIDFGHKYCFCKINGKLYESVGIGTMEHLKEMYKYKKQFKPKPKKLEQLGLF